MNEPPIEAIYIFSLLIALTQFGDWFLRYRIGNSVYLLGVYFCGLLAAFISAIALVVYIAGGRAGPEARCKAIDALCWLAAFVGLLNPVSFLQIFLFFFQLC
jgi:hypothetical protein